MTAESVWKIKFDILEAFLVISYGWAQARIHWKLTVEIIAFGYGKRYESVFFGDWRVTSATDVSAQGGCSCVQDISVTLCEENIMF